MVCYLRSLADRFSKTFAGPDVESYEVRSLRKVLYVRVSGWKAAEPLYFFFASFLRSRTSRQQTVDLLFLFSRETPELT